MIRWISYSYDAVNSITIKLKCVRNGRSMTRPSIAAATTWCHKMHRIDARISTCPTKHPTHSWKFAFNKRHKTGGKSFGCPVEYKRRHQKTTPQHHLAMTAQPITIFLHTHTHTHAKALLKFEYMPHRLNRKKTTLNWVSYYLFPMTLEAALCNPRRSTIAPETPNTHTHTQALSHNAYVETHSTNRSGLEWQIKNKKNKNKNPYAMVSVWVWWRCSRFIMHFNKGLTHSIFRY